MRNAVPLTASPPAAILKGLGGVDPVSAALAKFSELDVGH
jgi:hypothetical protein